MPEQGNPKNVASETDVNISLWVRFWNDGQSNSTDDVYRSFVSVVLRQGVVDRHLRQIPRPQCWTDV
jgi:hypothetical protein